MKALFWLFVLALPFAFPHPVNAEPLDFGPNLSRSGWVVVRFPRIPPASFRAADRSTLEVSTEAAAGLLWRRMREARHQGRLANWRWMVTEGVPPTDLTRRGKDDRTLGVYFIFGIAADASKAPLALLASPSVSALVYVFGGDKPRGSMLSSPHMGARGRFIILRPADAQKGAWFDETVDLAKDYARAFHSPPPLLIAIAISSDSDDTSRRSQATLRSLAIGR